LGAIDKSIKNFRVKTRAKEKGAEVKARILVLFFPHFFFSPHPPLSFSSLFFSPPNLPPRKGRKKRERKKRKEKKRRGEKIEKVGGKIREKNFRPLYLTFPWPLGPISIIIIDSKRLPKKPLVATAFKTITQSPSFLNGKYIPFPTNQR
jgi:hypothetical protein